MDKPLSFDTFHSIAEVAATFAGFVGLMVVLMRNDHQFARHLIIDFLFVTLGTVVFAYLPELIAGVGWSEDTTWRIACGSFGAYHLGIYSASNFRQKTIRPQGPMQLTLTVVSAPVILLKLAVGAGFGVNYAYEIYLLGLVWLVSMAIYIFSLMVLEETTQE